MKNQIFAQKNKKALNQDELDLLIEKFMERSGKTLQVDELDAILEILQMRNQDYRRVRRAKLINDINSRFKARNGNELIGRNRNTVDKRIMEYPIS